MTGQMKERFKDKKYREMMFRHGFGKYERDDEWRKLCSERSKKTWKKIGKKEMLKRLRSGVTVKSRKRISVGRQKYFENPEIREIYRKRMKKNNPMFDPQIKRKAIRNFKKTMKLKQLQQEIENQENGK